MSNLIYKKMSDVMKEIGSVGKDQKNVTQGFKFRGIDQFVNALYPALTKHGVFMTTEVLNEAHELKEVERSSGKKGVDKHVSIQMKYTFHAEDGSSVSSSVPAEGLDSGDKATNKALSAALKYALIQTFSIPTEDMEEADKESPTIQPKASLAKSESLSATVINGKGVAALIVNPEPFTTTAAVPFSNTVSLGSPVSPSNIPNGTTKPSGGFGRFKSNGAS